MRLACLANLALPSPDTYGEQLACSLAGLAAAGVDVDLFAPPTAGTSARVATLHQYYGVPSSVATDRLRWHGVPTPGRLRATRLGKAWADVVGSGLPDRGDLVLTRHWSAAALALARRRRVVFETYKTRVGGLRRLLWRHPRMVAAITHSEMSAEAVRKTGVAAHRVLVAYNGVWQAEIATGRREEPARAETACYAGHVRRDKGTDVLLDLAAGAPGMHVRVVGGLPGAPETERLRRLAAERGLQNLSLEPRVRPAEVPERLRRADILVVPPVSEPLRRWSRTVLPMKTFRYLAAGRPIFAPRLPDLEEVLVHGENAWLVDPDRPEEAARALQRLAANATLRRQLAHGARCSAQRFTWERRGELVRAFLHRLPGPE